MCTLCRRAVTMLFIGILVNGVIGCATSDPKVEEAQYAKSRAQTHYLTDDDGHVLLDVPPYILRSVVEQVSARGDTHTVTAIRELYDLETGHVRDERHAESINQLLPKQGKGKRP